MEDHQKEETVELSWEKNRDDSETSPLSLDEIQEVISEIRF